MQTWKSFDLSQGSDDCRLRGFVRIKFSEKCRQPVNANLFGAWRKEFKVVEIIKKTPNKGENTLGIFVLDITNVFFEECMGGVHKFGMFKCRTTDISRFQNYEY